MTTASASAWTVNAARLAEWTWDTLVNRLDVWGSYWPLSWRADRGNSWTAPAKRKRGSAKRELPVAA